MSLTNITRPGQSPQTGDIVKVTVGRHVVRKQFLAESPDVLARPRLTIDRFIEEIGDTVFDEFLALDSPASKRMLRRLDYVRTIQCGSDAADKLFNFLVANTSLTGQRRDEICAPR